MNKYDGEVESDSLKVRLVLAELGSEEGTADCEIDLKELRILRRRWPSVQELRADIIAREVASLADEER